MCCFCSGLIRDERVYLVRFTNRNVTMLLEKPMGMVMEENHASVGGVFIASLIPGGCAESARVLVAHPNPPSFPTSHPPILFFSHTSSPPSLSVGAMVEGTGGKGRGAEEGKVDGLRRGRLEYHRLPFHLIFASPPDPCVGRRKKVAGERMGCACVPQGIGA